MTLLVLLCVALVLGGLLASLNDQFPRGTRLVRRARPVPALAPAPSAAPRYRARPRGPSGGPGDGSSRAGPPGSFGGSPFWGGPFGRGPFGGAG
jgi:hypothetical protein